MERNRLCCPPRLTGPDPPCSRPPEPSRACCSPASPATVSHAADQESCRPDGLHKTPGVDVPYCSVYDTEGRERMGADHQRRVIGYFTGWRTGKDGTPAYLASDIPWDKVTHLNYAFAHIDGGNKISVGTDGPANPATGMTWPGSPARRRTRRCPTRATSTC
ncbi:Chitinase OS=Streptomyces glaucescens OX=1907 GN=SGLAU_05820 PE=4 SV=1 [Streptomyces glaucescens]